jgi:hypothetical protein
MEKEGEVVGKRIQEMLSGIVLKIGTASATKGDGYGDNGGEDDRGELKEDEDEHEMRVLWTRTRKTERSRDVVLAGPGPTTVLESWKTLCE